MGIASLQPIGRLTVNVARGDLHDLLNRVGLLS